MPSPRLLVTAAALTVTLGACTGSETPPPSPATPADVTLRPSATSAVAFRADRLEDAGWVRNEDLSDATREQYQDARCVVQLVILPESGPQDDAGDTDLALAALGEEFTNPEERPDVAVPASDGTVAMRARRVEVDTGTETLAMQVAMRVLGDQGVTVAVTHACYDHTVTDAEFDAVVGALELTGVEPSGL